MTSPAILTSLWGFFFLVSSFAISAQSDQGFIYGTVILKNGKQFTGQIRLDDEKALWNDVFNAYKLDRPAQNLLTKAEARQLENRTDDFQFGFMELWADKSEDVRFFFRCEFGAIESLQSVGKERVLLRLKNGDTIPLKITNGSDLAQSIWIYDQFGGQVELDFSNIQAMKFSAPPTTFRSSLGQPVYARVLTTMGSYEGYITWDMEECLGKDLIEGRQNRTKIDIPFENIATLKTQGDGSLLSLKSGRTMFLNDHNDVDRGNRGILIRGLSFGKLEVKWKNFISATFLEPKAPPQAYRDYQPPKLLKGIVHLKNGEQYQGQLVYDLDEIYDVEFLNGENNGFEYYIPFGKIKTVEPQNDKFSLVILKDGSQFLLGNNDDVSTKNHGLIVKRQKADAKYITWETIKHIEFD